MLKYCNPPTENTYCAPKSQNAYTNLRFGIYFLIAKYVILVKLDLHTTDHRLNSNVPHLKPQSQMSN